MTSRSVSKEVEERRLVYAFRWVRMSYSGYGYVVTFLYVCVSICLSVYLPACLAVFVYLRYVNVLNTSNMFKNCCRTNHYNQLYKIDHLMIYLQCNLTLFGAICSVLVYTLQSNTQDTHHTMYPLSYFIVISVPMPRK